MNQKLSKNVLNHKLFGIVRSKNLKVDMAVNFKTEMLV